MIEQLNRQETERISGLSREAFEMITCGVADSCPVCCNDTYPWIVIDENTGKLINLFATREKALECAQQYGVSTDTVESGWIRQELVCYSAVS